MLRLWFTVDAYKKASFLDKLFNNVMNLACLAFIITALLYQLANFTLVDMHYIVLKITHILMLFIGFNMVFIGTVYRSEFSQVIEYVNAKSKAVLEREDRLKFRPLRNKIYVTSTRILLAMSAGAFITPFPYLLETLRTGRLYFGTFLPFDQSPYSTSVYIQCAVQLILIYWMLTYGMLFLAIIFEPVLQLGYCYKILAGDMRSIRKNGRKCQEDVEMNRLKSIVAEYNEVFG